jgi:spermidine synthase
LLASPVAITRSDLEAIELVDDLKFLTRNELYQAFLFQERIAKLRHDVTIHTLDCPQLFYYLLNPLDDLNELDNTDKEVDFIDIVESSNGLIKMRDSLKLESMAQIWVEAIYKIKRIQIIIQISISYYPYNIATIALR